MPKQQQDKARIIDPQELPAPEIHNRLHLFVHKQLLCFKQLELKHLPPLVSLTSVDSEQFRDRFLLELGVRYELLRCVFLFLPGQQLQNDRHNRSVKKDKKI